MSNSSASIAVHGPTLTLRLPVREDAAALLELAGDPEVTRWFSWGPYTSIDQPLYYIDGLESWRDSGEQLDFLVVHREHGPAGITGLNEFSPRDLRCMVGTWFGRRFWGTGANRESKALIAHLAFRVLGLERLGAYADLDNPRSQRALTNLGFEREGVLRRWHRHGSEVHDVLVFSWLRDEWELSPLAAIEVRMRGEPPAPFVVRRQLSSNAAPS
jgi:RimJ/RimL family protein N-acetyltransferase